MLDDRPAVPRITRVTTAERLEPLVIRSDLAWRLLWLRVRTITPVRLARGGLVVGALAAIIWLLAATWSELLPFQVGLLLAYITFPVVNALDRVLPRWLAASLVVVLEIAAMVLLIGLLVPPVVLELGAMLAALPDISQLQERIVELRARLNELPEPTQALVRGGIDQVVQNLRSNLLAYLQTGAAVAITSVLGLFNTLGFVLGFFGIPTWLVAVLSDHRAGIRLINRLLPDWLRADFWAVVRIADRSFGAFLRGQLILAAAVALLTYGGLTYLDRVGPAVVHYQLVLAVIAGVFQLIPAVGPILSTLAATAIGLTTSPRAGLAILALYLVIQLVQGRLIAPHLQRFFDFHPALFVIVLVVLSQFGFVWVLFAAPLSVAVRDMFRYVYGRLGEPPRPAGLLPGESAPVSTRLARVTQHSVREVGLHG